MEPPPVQFVTTRDGLSIAYGVSGSGLPLVFLPGGYDHLQLAWQYPNVMPWLEALVARFQLIQLDPRGFGMSSRGLAPTHTADDCQLDLEAVVERLKLDRFILFGTGPLSIMAAQYAAEHPDRISALVLGCAMVKQTRPTLFEVVVLEDWDWFLDSLDAQVHPGRTPEEARRASDMMKLAWDKEDLSLRMKAFAAVDTAALYARVRVPTLVLFPRDYVLMEAGQSQEAARLCSGRMVLIEGRTQYGDADQGIQAVEDFLADVLPAQAATALPPSSLSSREVEVLRLIATGKTNPQIAEELVISLNTVQRHVGNILTKTGLVNRTEAALFARDNGLTGPLPAAALSEREVEVLRLIATGQSSREIGEALVLSVRTVERHIANIYRKTDTHGRAQVTAYAMQRGLA